MVKCKDRDILFNATWNYINGAWVAAITACYQGIQRSSIPRVENVELTLNDDGTVSVTWDSHARFKTVVDFKIDGGSWTSNTYAAGVGEA